MTQQELAKKIGVDSSTISRKLASDGLKFTVGEVHEIAEVLELSASECKDFFFVLKLAYLRVSGANSLTPPTQRRAHEKAPAGSRGQRDERRGKR